MKTVSDIRNELKEKYKNGEFVVDKTGGKVVEIIAAQFLADEDHILREPNYDYIERELEWYQSCSLKVDDIPGETPQIWKAVSSTEGEINSNYGYLIYSGGNNYQFEAVAEELIQNPDSRRAIMIYTRPSMHQDYNRDGMSDFVCTNTVQYVIRNNKLDCIVSMRSNDAVFGYNNDLAWQNEVLEELTDVLQDWYPTLVKGDIIWQAGSLHVYDRHFKFLEE